MPVLSAEQVYAVAREAGFSPDQAQTMTSIALAESGGDSAHRGASEDSRGLWQINGRAHPELAERYDLDDPLGNARAAYELSRSGTDLSPWTVTHNRVGRRFLLGGALALAAALGIGLWVGSTIGDGGRTSTLTTPAPVATTATPPPPPSPLVTTPPPTPTVTTLPPPQPPQPTQPATEPTPAEETPEEPAEQPPDVLAVRAVPISPNGCVQPWTAQIVAAVTGEVSAVTAVWTPTDGGDAVERALSATGIAWTGQLDNLPPRTPGQLTVRAEGSGGTDESDGQPLAFPCGR